MSLIEARNLVRKFDDVVAVDDLSFRVEAGEVVGLLGANGAGKTTAMRMLLGLLTPSSGEALVAGTPARRLDRRLLGYVPQSLGLYRDLTVSENLAFAAAAFDAPIPALDEAGLSGIGDVRVANLSLGQRRRVAFLVARCHDPQVLILDEPTSGVGPLGRARLWETVHAAAAAGTAVLVSTHYMDEAEECDRVVLMAGGRAVASGTVQQVIADAISVEVSGDVPDAAFDVLRHSGATVLLDGRRWRVVGLDRSTVSEIVGSTARAEEVPATFEEAFVALST